MEIVKKYIFIISLHKKRKWLSYGAYAPLRQPRLSPLCGCECELIKNVCFFTFLVADIQEVLKEMSQKNLIEKYGKDDKNKNIVRKYLLS